MKHWMLAIGLVLGGTALIGCGDSGGGKQLCMDTCEKTNECFDMMQDCAEQCSGGSDGDGTSCSNQGEINDHIDMCNSGECGDMGTEYSTCLSEAPACE